MSEYKKVVLDYPVSELHPLHYKPLPTLAQLRKGITNGLKIIEERLEELKRDLKRRGRSLETVDEDELFTKIVEGNLHVDTEEIPGLSMASYWLLDRVGKKDWVWENSDHIITWADIYIMLCAMQRNRFRWVLQFHYFPKIYDEEDWRGEYEGFSFDKAAFPPEGFRSKPRIDEENGNTYDDWETIREADIALEQIREFVLSNAIKTE